MLKKIKGFLGLEKSMSAVLIMVIFVGMGEKLAERFLPGYIIALGGTSIIAGYLNGIDNLLSALYSYPGGYLSDKLGYKRALIFFNLFAMTGYVIVILFPTWQAVLLGAVFFISWDALSLPATMSLVSKVLPKEKRTMGVSLHSLMRRIPMAAGPILGGVMIKLYGEIDGIRYSFIIALTFAVLSLILQQIFMEEEIRSKEHEAVPRSFRLVFTPELKALLISDILIRYCEQIPYAFMWIWCKNFVSPVEFGVLTAIEMTTALLVYIPVAAMADKTSKKPFVTMTFVFFTLFPITLLYSKSFIMLVFAFIIRGLKEFGEPTRKALIVDLAPEGLKAYTFGVYYLLRDIVVSIAAFSSGYLWSVSPAANLYTATAFGVIGTVYFAVYGKEIRLNKI